MKLGKAFANPVVLGGGVVIGVILLVAGRGGNSASAPSSSNGVNDAMAANNSHAMDFMATMAGISANAENQRYTARIADNVTTANLVSNLASIAADQATKLAVSDNEIVKTRIASETARALDRDANYTRMMTSYVAGEASRHGVNAAIESNRLSAATKRLETLIQSLGIGASSAAAIVNTSGNLLATSMPQGVQAAPAPVAPQPAGVALIGKLIDVGMAYVTKGASTIAKTGTAKAA